MKGKLIKNMLVVSENEMIAKDTEVDITNIFTESTGKFSKCNVGYKEVIIDADAIEITDYSPIINWEQRRYEIAKDILAAFNPINSRSNPDLDAKCAIIYTDALIKQLKSN